MRRLSSLMPLWLASSTLLACSADAVTEPEPKLETPGAFVAVASSEGGYLILRTLTSIRFDNGQDAFFFKAYEPLARDFAEAERLARDPELPVSRELVVWPRTQVTSVEWRVVWFRTLSEEESSILD